MFRRDYALDGRLTTARHRIAASDFDTIVVHSIPGMFYSDSRQKIIKREKARDIELVKLSEVSWAKYYDGLVCFVSSRAFFSRSRISSRLGAGTTSTLAAAAGAGLDSAKGSAPRVPSGPTEPRPSAVEATSSKVLTVPLYPIFPLSLFCVPSVLFVGHLNWFTLRYRAFLGK